MKRNLTLGLLLTACTLPISGCGDSYESVVDDSIATMKDLVAELKNIKDAQTAKAAAPKLEAIGKKMKELDDRRKAIGEPSSEVKAELEKKYKDQLESISKDLFSEMMRVAMLGPEVQKELQSIESAMKGMN